MSDYTVIADVGETLINLLRGSLTDLLDADSIVLLSPADVEGDKIRLTLFLYHVVENPFLKNQEPAVEGAHSLRHPALYLDLYYMLTSFASSQINDRSERTLEEHRILGRAMRVLHDNAVLAGSVLQGSLAGTGEEFSICLNPMTLEDMNRIWETFPTRSYRASIAYLVSGVCIDSTRTSEARRLSESDI